MCTEAVCMHDEPNKEITIVNIKINSHSQTDEIVVLDFFSIVVVLTLEVKSFCQRRLLIQNDYSSLVCI